VVELAPVSRAAHVARAVASALSVDEQPGQKLIDTIVARIGKHRRLVVIDNCEHLLGACGKLAEALLASCPQVRILATSREALGVDAERVWEVPALAVPDPGEETPDALAGCSAVELFVERACSVQPGFASNAYVGPAVAEVCRRLDGIPLAIELAAARVESLTPQEIARRLNDRFGLLTTGPDAAVARHQTLQAAMDWSHDLLTEPEQMLLRRLSVFLGGFDVEAAEAVCGDELGAGQLAGVLGALVSKSLVAGGGEGGRFGLLETIRAYAGDRLEEAGEGAALRGAHAHFYLALAERAEPELTGPKQQDWFERLEAERGNVRCAVEWSVGHGRGEWALRTAGALVLFWRVRCRYSEGRDLLGAALSASDGAEAVQRATALWGMGFLELMAGNSGCAVESLEESLRLYREVDHKQGCARALLILGNCQQFTDPGRSLTSLEESARLARAAGDLWCLSHALGVEGFERAARDELSVARRARDQQGLRMGLLGLGSVALRQGDYGLAESALDDALAIAGELGDGYARATALQYLGELALSRGQYARARMLLTEALALPLELQSVFAVVPALIILAAVARAEGDPVVARGLFEEVLVVAGGHRHPHALQGMAELAADEGDARAARRLLEEALDVCRRSHRRSVAAEVLQSMGELARAEGDAKRAFVLHTEALELFHQIGSTPDVVASLESLGALVAAAGRHEQAVRLFGATEAVRLANGYARAPWRATRFDDDTTLARDALGPEGFHTAMVKGAAMPLQEAVGMFRGGRGRPASGWSSLTLAERRVADLVAEGLTNPEIAKRLFISLSTVKAHLSHTFAKLGVTGRRELAREVQVRSRLPDPYDRRASRTK